MKKTIIFKLLVICLLIILGVILGKIILKQYIDSLFPQKMNHMAQDEIVLVLENITDKKLIELYHSSNLVLNTDLHKLDDFSVEFIEGEYWYGYDIWLSGSVSSLDEAKKIALDFAKSDKYATDYCIEYIGENNLYYQLRVQRGDSTYRINFFKDSIIKFPENDSNHYSFSDVIFQELDYNIVFTIMDLVTGKPLYRYFEDKGNQYIYTDYWITKVWGDWGLNNTISLEKNVTKIDKNTGFIYRHSSVIKKDIEIP